jgi:abortive infection bacteriophage resistance protein
MKYLKTTLSVEEQLAKLKSRGLKAEDEEGALSYLLSIGYFRLKPYTYPFQNNVRDVKLFKDEVTFEKIIALYEFDSNLRVLLFDAIGKIEIALRSQMINQYSLRNGSHWQLNSDLFRDSERFVVHFEKLNKEINRSNEAFIHSYKCTYSEPIAPPIWMSLEVSSLGLLSKIFQNLKKCPEKIAITHIFGISDVSVLENWMLCFSIVRNICAHHGRLWNRRFNHIKLPRHPLDAFLDNTSIFTNKLYATLTCIEYSLQHISPNSTIKNNLKNLMVFKESPPLKQMGFPKNWNVERLWN